MKYRATVSLCIIVKNEEKFIDKCLSSASDVVNEIIIVDTGSTDDTIKIAEGYNAQIYHFTWNDSFSDARNFSISKARFDWILLLDADEMLDAGDKTKFLDYINTTKSDGCHFLTYNYIGEIGQGSYSLHNAFRLLRNNRRYRFEGAIHEQIRRIDGKDIEPGTFDVQDIHIHHYGYLDEVVREKNKRERNVPIITRLLERDPNNSFMLFNLGNEYMASGKYTEALEQYDKAYGSMDTTQAYAPHLIYRRAMCMYTLRQFQATIHTLAEGLAKYPACTDFEYLRGTVYTEWGRYTLAIDSFEKCIRMGEPHSSLKFIDFCATTRPLISLGQVYHRLLYQSLQPGQHEPANTLYPGGTVECAVRGKGCGGGKAMGLSYCKRPYPKSGRHVGYHVKTRIIGLRSKTPGYCL
jgi:glycosyltransferase involved in cell wall biosynthesis